MNLSDAGTIAAIATPFTQLLIDTFLKPNLEALKNRLNSNDQILDHSIENKFTNYLNNLYRDHITVNTIAFKKKKIYLTDIYIPLTIKGGNDEREIRINEINSEVFTSNKVLIIDSAGMGKSTITKKLLLSCIELNYGIPVLIELRRLNRSKDIVDEMIEQLAPINQKIDKQLVLDLIQRGDFIFFLDGYDEVEPEIKTYATNLINNFVSKAGNNKFLLTSRPEGATLSFGNFEKFKINPLTPTESFDLIRKYDDTNEVAELLIQKIKDPNIYSHISEYLISPLLVSLLFVAFEYKQKIPFEKHNFYRQVFDSLFESHDLSKGDSYERKRYTNLTIDQFHKLLRICAFNCLKEGNKIEFKLDEFIKLLEQSIADYYGLDCTASDFKKDLLINVPIFKEDGMYIRWSHKSLQEYFSAQYIYYDSKELQKDLLEHIAFHPKNDIYINTLDLYRSIDEEFFNDVVVYKLLTNYFIILKNYFKYITDQDERMKRIGYLFSNKLVIGKFDFNDSILRGNFYEIIRSKFDESIEIGVFMAPIHEEKIDYLKIPFIPENNSVLLKLLNYKNYEFVKPFTSLIKYEDFEMKIEGLEFNQAYEIDESVNNIFNKGENFVKTNKLLDVFLGHQELYYIDEILGQVYLDKISQKIKNRAERKNFNF